MISSVDGGKAAAPCCGSGERQDAPANTNFMAIALLDAGYVTWLTNMILAANPL